jgi:hypothetical protein
MIRRGFHLNKEASESGQRGIVTAQLIPSLAVIAAVYVKKLFRTNELLFSLQRVKEIGEPEKEFYLLVVLNPLCEDLSPRMWVIASPQHPHQQFNPSQILTPLLRDY